LRAASLDAATRIGVNKIFDSVFLTALDNNAVQIGGGEILFCHFRAEIAGEADVKVPFILRLKWLHAASNRMLWKFGEVWFPNRVAGKILFVVSANSAFELLARFIRLDFDTVMHAADADTVLHPLLELCHARAIALHHFVIRPAVHVEDNRVRTIEYLLFLRPAVEHDVHVQAGRTLRETLCEKLYAGIELVHPRWMRRFAGDEYELLLTFGSFGECGRGSDSDGEEQNGKETHDEEKGAGAMASQDSASSKRIAGCAPLAFAGAWL